MAEQLENLSDLPGTAAQSSANGDLLSYVLSQIRLSGDRIFTTIIQNGEAISLSPHWGHVCMVREGALRFDGDDVALAGDLVLFPRGAGELHVVALEVPTTVIVCRFRFDPDTMRGMVMALPPYILIGQAEGAGWLDGFLHFLMIEAGDVQPGAALMVSRLIDLAVIRALRTWVQRGQTSGWLGGLSDERIARTLKAIHEAPTQRWSINTLATIAGMSRSSFCERFTALVGCAPLRYQNEWRLTLARDMLLRGQARIGEIGLIVGYESEAAFSRAYKALFGHSPAVNGKRQTVRISAANRRCLQTTGAPAQPHSDSPLPDPNTAERGSQAQAQPSQRPGLSNILKIASRVAPGFMLKQMIKLSQLSPRAA